MIDARAIVQRFSRAVLLPEERIPRLGWENSLAASSGQGITLGLLDTRILTSAPELSGANVELRDFAGGVATHPDTAEHGTYSAVMLVGQGNAVFRGLVPRARLLVGNVVGTHGIAAPAAVAHGLDWLLDAGAQIIALPLGDEVEWPIITARLERAACRRVMVLAATGTGHPAIALFPSRHPTVIAVAAADLDGRLLTDARRTPRVDLAAPGLTVPAPTQCHEIHWRTGSSVACIIAAGIAALSLACGVVLPTRIPGTG